MNIYKLLQVIGLMIILSCLAACIAPMGKPTPEPTKALPTSTPLPERTECNVLRVSGSEGWYPYFIRNQDTNKIEGVAVDLLKKMGQELGVTVQVIENIPWKRLFLMMDDGSLDLIAGVYWTEERAEKYLYTIPFMRDEARVFVLKGHEFPFEELSDLKGMVGGRPLGGSYGEEFDQYAKEHLIFEEVEGKEAIIEKLIRERNDYAVFAYWDAMAYLRQTGLDEKIVALPKPITVNEVYLLVSRASPCSDLVDQMDELLEQYIEDGTIDAMVESYGSRPD